MAESPIVVIDNGGCTIKAGFAGEDHPTVILPNAVGLAEYSNLADRETFVRFMDASSSGELKTRRPISNGAVTNWEDMETVWRSVIEDHLHVSPEEASVLITEPMNNPKPARQKMAEILFESINFSAVSIATSPILPMYAAGRTTGIVLDIGDGTTQVVPVWGGYPITDAMQRVDLGGHWVTQLLKKEMMSNGRAQGRFANATTPIDVFKLIKEKACHVAPDYASEKGKGNSSTFELPDGEKVTLGEEAFKCPEFLFNPSLFEDTQESNHVGVHRLLYKSIQKTNIDVRKDLYSNIVVTGGSTLFPGFVERLESELKTLVPASVPIKITAHAARKYFTWIGGSVLASLASFPNTLITKESWEDGSGKVALEKLCS